LFVEVTITNIGGMLILHLILNYYEKNTIKNKK